MSYRFGRAKLLRRALGLVVLSAVAAATAYARDVTRPLTSRAAADSVPDSTADSAAARVTDATVAAAVHDIVGSLLGASGKLTARFVAPAAHGLAIPMLERLFGDSAATRPGVYALRDTALDHPFSLITLLPFTAKVHGRIGDYRMGYWPQEEGRVRSAAYVNPRGFIRVTPQNEDTYVSEHFRLRDFLTHDQQSVWPKYLVLREPLLDKLELVIADLNAHGVPVRHMTVMSGFRTPQYNEQGVGKGGRAEDSRHQYGDASDVFVDNDGNGWMDDLNHDGRIDYHDAQVIEHAVERVEAAHPELVGGCGVYRRTSAHGPFTHIDVRGRRARWGLIG